jgi:hypothetical protein
MNSSLQLWIGVSLFAFASACGPAPQPNVTPPPTATAEAPPPPKCESLTEKCAARSSTEARIPGIGLVITPPRGWIYAQEAEATLAEKAGDKQAVLILATFDPPKHPLELKKARVDFIDKLGKKVGVQLANKNIIDVHVSATLDKLTIGSMELSIWEQVGARRGSTKGNVVVVSGTVDKKDLVLFAFAPQGALDDSDALNIAIQSLKKAGGSRP